MTKVCIGCGCSMEGKRPHAQYCTRTCKDLWKQREVRGTADFHKEGKPSRICGGCEVEFKPRNHNQVYCNKACGDSWRQRNVYRGKYTIDYRSASPGNYMSALLSYYKRRATLSTDDLLEIWDKQKGICALSGVPMTHQLGEGRLHTNASIDQIKAGGGYTPSNVRLVCSMVNKMRQDMSDEDLLDWCRKILEHNKD